MDRLGIAGQAFGIAPLDRGFRLAGRAFTVRTVPVAAAKGTVGHGVCRDSARSLELGYPIFSRGAYMRTGKDRVQADGYQVPVSLGEVRVEPGDMLVGDGDGVVVIPMGREEDVLAASREIAEAEERIRREIGQGTRLD